MPQGIKAGEAFVKIVADTTALKRGLKRAQARLRAFGSAARQVGRRLAVLGGALTTPFAFGVKEFTKFETALARVDVLLEGSTGQLKKFRGEIIGMASEFGVEKSVIVRGLEDILQASIRAEDATTVLRSALKLSAIGFTDVKVAADAITSVMNAYGVGVDRAAQISDQLFKTVSLGKTTFEVLGNSISNVTSIAAGAGISFEEILAALANMTKRGLRTEIAVTSLSAALITFLKPQDDARELAAKFGLELSASALATDGLFKSLNKLKGLPADVIAKIFPNKRALKATLSLLGDLEDFEKTVEKISRSTGLVDDRFKKLTKTLGFFFNVIIQKGKRALLFIGEALEKDVRKIAKTIGRLVDKLTKLIKANKELIPKLAKAALAIAAVGIALVALGVAATIGAIAMSVVSSAIIAFSLVIALALSPVGLLIGLVVTLGVVIARRFGLIKKASMRLAEGFKKLQGFFVETFAVIFSSIKSGDFEGALKTFTSAVKLIFAKFINTVIEGWERLKASIKNITIAIGFSILRAFNNGFASAKVAFIKFKRFVLDGLIKLKNDILNLFDFKAKIRKIKIEAPTTFKKAKFVLKAATKEFVARVMTSVPTSGKTAQQREDLFIKKSAGIRNQLRDEFRGLTKEVIANNKKIKAENIKAKKLSEADSLATQKQKLAENKLIDDIETTAKDLDLRLLEKAESLKDKNIDEIVKSSDAVKKSTDRLMKAQEAYDKAVQEATATTKRNNEAQKQKDENESIRAKTGTRDPFDELKKKIKDFFAVSPVETLEKVLTSRGSFSGIGIERGARLTFENNLIGKQEQIIDELRKIKRNTKETSGQGVFQ